MLFLVRNFFGFTLLSDFLVILRTQFFFISYSYALTFSYDINNYFHGPYFLVLHKLFSAGYSHFQTQVRLCFFLSIPFFYPLPLLLYTTLNSISFLSIHFISEVLQEERGGFFCYAVYKKKETTGKLFDLTSDRIFYYYSKYKRLLFKLIF